MHALDAGLVINALSGLFMIALGVFVLTVRSGKRVNLGFALFAVPFGCTWILENVWGPSGDHRSAWVLISIGILLTVAGLGLVLLAAAFHQSGDASSRRHAGWAVLIGVGVLLADSALFLPTYEVELQAKEVLFVQLAGFWVFHAAAWGLLAFLALRYLPTLQERPVEAAGIRLMSLALVLYPAFFATREMVVTFDVMGWPRTLVLSGVALVLVKTGGLAALWLRNAAVSSEDAVERWLAWAVVAAALVGVPDAGFGDSANHPGFGIARTLGVVILAYAILRHQLLGIDVKVRWTISKSTVAAVFIAVFFVASEAAQEFLGDTTGSSYLGIAAAGGLVFAIAPLQRAAERLAERAVPAAEVHPAKQASSPREEAFRNVLRVALRGPGLTRDDEVRFYRLAEELGIGAGRAHEILSGVEAEREVAL